MDEHEHGDAAEMERYLKNVGHWHAYLTTVAQRTEEKTVLEARAAAIKGDVDLAVVDQVKRDVKPPTEVKAIPPGHADDAAYFGSIPPGIQATEPLPPDDPPKPNRRLGIGAFKRDR